MTYDEMKQCTPSVVYNAWGKYNKETIYSLQNHLKNCDHLEELGRLSRLFMSLPVHSNTEMVWSDINRMNTLNANQANAKKEKHICPLQFDIIERLITRFTNPGDLIDDPFGGLFSTAYKAIEMKRRCVSVELNPEYYQDGIFYVKSKDHKINVPTLFDFA